VSTDWNGEDRRRIDHEERFASIDARLDRGNVRLDALDRGQAHIIKVMEEQDAERREMREEMKRNTAKTDATLAGVGQVITLAENMQRAGRFFNRLYDGFAWFWSGASHVAKILVPIVTLIVLVWGMVWAYLNGGKPPSAP
jgi:hypothetical protein